MRLISYRRPTGEGPDGEVSSQDRTDQGCADEPNLSDLATFDTPIGGLRDTDGVRYCSLRETGLQSEVAPLPRELRAEAQAASPAAFARAVP